MFESGCRSFIPFLFGALVLIVADARDLALLAVTSSNLTELTQHQFYGTVQEAHFSGEKPPSTPPVIFHIHCGRKGNHLIPLGLFKPRETASRGVKAWPNRDLPFIFVTFCPQESERSPSAEQLGLAIPSSDLGPVKV